jgi:hypothetical protein
MGMAVAPLSWKGQQRKYKGQDDDTNPHEILLLHPKCCLDNMVPY